MRVKKYFAVYTPSGFPLLQKLSKPSFQSFKYIHHRVYALTEFFFQEVPEASNLVHLHDFKLCTPTS
jgi:hypothetical protein